MPEMDADPDTAYNQAKARLADPDGREEAAATFDRLAGAGHARAAFRLAEMLLSDPAQTARAVTLLRQAAEAGHARAAFRLGLAYANGTAGLERDLAEAARWCERAATKGLAVAQFNLALLHARDDDASIAQRWLRLASLNGLPEADGCLDFLAQDPGALPRTWEEADTRASVVLGISDPAAPKTVRFAEYYIDPCLDLLARRLSLRRDENEDIVQQFFVELEEPLAKGEHRGRAWKQVLRMGYDPGRGAFRPFLARVLVNFARDWLRQRADQGRTGMVVRDDEGDLVECHRDDWLSLLDRFAAEVGPRRADAAQAVGVVRSVLVEDLGQAELAPRLGVTDRTVRARLRLGAGLLAEWLTAAVDALSASAAESEQLRRGIEQVPEWLRHPSAEKRRRTLLLLALAARRLR
jgi:DNA-directed RNA polymerase specialized sigma24 family protein